VMTSHFPTGGRGSPHGPAAVGTASCGAPVGGGGLDRQPVRRVVAGKDRGDGKVWKKKKKGSSMVQPSGQRKTEVAMMELCCTETRDGEGRQLK
jgi:hypothetical protein